MRLRQYRIEFVLHFRSHGFQFRLFVLWCVQFVLVKELACVQAVARQ